ncbi:hypothetical protein [Prevotella sp. E2-28]|uniref:hypothetical protein n=1 Tax=Prevotella sp. E2-28 TaxID=2913620 RepID=UPI001EDA3A73|nr:hypothetical protein [Prevotella sp. E2-28]UKK54059.1 hypothetical protein L6465_01965 [Prevotella sp. E2-28]
MRNFTKAFLMLLLCTLSVLTTQAKTEKVHATFESPSNTNTSWDAGTKTFTWSTTYYNQLRNIGLPTGDLTKYKKLVVDCTIKSGDQFRILFYKGGSNLTLYAKDGVNEFILADTLKALYPNDYNEYLLACDEICLSGNNAAAPGEAVINDMYLETYDDEGEKVYATFESPSNTNTNWDAGTKTFTWSTTYYNQLRNIGLPSGDITKYKKLVVDCEIKSGDQFRVLIYKGGSNLTLYAKNGVNEFILADTLKALYPNDYNEYLLACDEICLSGNNAAAPGEAVINAVYLETYPENESVEIPEIQYEEDPGKPEGDFVDFIEVFSTLQPRIGLGEDTHPIVLGNGDVVVGQRTKDIIADLSAYSKLTMVTSPNLKLVVYMNHEVDAQQNAGDYAAADSGKYVFLNVQADENGIAEVDLTQYTKQDLNCICLPWDNNNKGTVWYLLLTKKADTPAEPIYIETDLTAQFNSLATTKWTGSSGQVGWAAPTVTTNSGLNVAAWEKYDGSCDWTGDIMSSSVTGLAPGTYKIELYGAAAFTFGRGFGSTAFTGDFTKDSNTAYSENDAITENTGVTLFAETAEGKVSKEIPIWYATNFNTSGIATATLENVIVGDAGTIKIGLSKTSTSTNWHVVQLKGVTAQVDAVELHATTLAAAQTALNAEENAIVTGDERDSLTAAITENTTVAEQTADAYKAAIAALNKAISAFTGAKAAYEALATAKAEKAAMTFAYASVDKKNAAEATLTAEATSAADATAKTEAITKAYRQYAESSALLEGVEGATNVTDSITNPAAEAAVAAPWNVVLGEGSGGNIDVKTNEPWTDGDDNATHKYFDGGNWGAQAWDVALQQKIALPAGKYMLTAKGRASADVDLRLFAGVDTVKMASIGATGGLFDRGWNDSSVEFEVAKADSIVIGVRGVTNMQYNWMSFADFRLVKFPAASEEEMAALNEEIATAKTLGVDVTAYEGKIFLPGEVAPAVEALKVAEYAQVNKDYTVNAAVLIPDFAQWTGDMVSNKGQHWDGTSTSTYYEQTSAQWGQSSWTNNKQTTVKLPKGKYVLYAAGRASAGTGCTAYIKVGDVTRKYTSKGDVGFGIATDGTATFSPEATYANGGKGRGFEYRYVAFEVTAEEGEEISLEVGGSATAEHQWMSFTAPVLLTTEDNAAIMLPILNNKITVAKAELETIQGTVGNGLFQKPQAAYDEYATAVATADSIYTAAGATADAIKDAIALIDAKAQAFAAAPTNAPSANKVYTFQLRLGGETPLYMNLTEGGITIAEEATHLKFVAVEGAQDQYNLTNEDGTLFVGLAGGNAWTMSTLADKKAAWTFTALPDGAYRINNLVTAGRFVGTNAAEKTAGSTCYADKQTSNGNVDWVIAEFHTWDFTKWSEATVANLKADAAASKLEGWSDVEKKADAEADVEPTEASKDNCFWATVTPDENGELSANDVVIEELKGLAFNSTYSTARSLAIAVNYPVALSTYAGPAYLWLGGGGKNVDCFVIKNVKAGTQIKMGVESHKTSEGRGVQLFVEGAEGARGAKLAAPDGSDVAVPSVYEEQTWAVPGEDGVCNIIVYNTKGCHIYFIDAEIGETGEPTGISTMKGNDFQNGVIYNLNGQKVQKAQRGLYIINGKKVVVK